MVQLLQYSQRCIESHDALDCAVLGVSYLVCVELCEDLFIINKEEIFNIQSLI